MADPCASEPEPAVTPVEADVIEKANAGAQLYYSIFYSDAKVVTGLPDSIVRAYGRAQKAFGQPRG